MSSIQSSVIADLPTDILLDDHVTAPVTLLRRIYAMMDSTGRDTHAIRHESRRFRIRARVLRICFVSTESRRAKRTELELIVTPLCSALLLLLLALSTAIRAMLLRSLRWMADGADCISQLDGDAHEYDA